MPDIFFSHKSYQRCLGNCRYWRNVGEKKKKIAQLVGNKSLVDLVERCLLRRGILWTIAIIIKILINHRQTVLTPRENISNCFTVKKISWIFSFYRKQCLLLKHLFIFASRDFLALLLVLPDLWISFQSLMPKQGGDPGVSLLELVNVCLENPCVQMWKPKQVHF